MIRAEQSVKHDLWPSRMGKGLISGGLPTPPERQLLAMPVAVGCWAAWASMTERQHDSYTGKDSRLTFYRWLQDCTGRWCHVGACYNVHMFCIRTACLPMYLLTRHYLTFL